MKFHGGVNGCLLLFPPPAGGILRPLLLGLLGGFSFLPALCRGRSGNVPGTVGAALALAVSLILGGFLLLGLRRLLFSAARLWLCRLCLRCLSRFGGCRVVFACGPVQPKRGVQITLFKSGHNASIPASGRLPFSRCWRA